jgi:septum formation protein
MRLVLASASAARADMLRHAGLAFETIPATVDEAALRQHLVADGAAISDIAALLAEAKAKVVSAARPDDLIIGADQILVQGHAVFEKPTDLRAARETLQKLRGQTHELISAVALVRGGHCLWYGSEEARLTMRDFSNAFLEDYLEREGDALLSSVGAYRLEGPGAQLFDRIDGDYFTILGLPLLSLLAVLREAGVIPA